jgi:hypothetical protein
LCHYNWPPESLAKRWKKESVALCRAL